MPEQAATGPRYQRCRRNSQLKTLLGFDYGQRRIGVAVGQDITATATALCTIGAGRSGPDWDNIDRLVDEWQPQELVVGLPRHADGSESGSSRAARGFARQLGARYGLPVHLMDERLSSVAATEMQRRNETHARTGLDALAASIILQDWLDNEPE